MNIILEEGDVPCHAADHAGIVAVIREPQIGRVAIHSCRAQAQCLP